MTAEEFDFALTDLPNGMLCRLPAPVGHALKARGYNRAVLVVTEDGLLIKPYVSADSDGRRAVRSVDLPEWA